MIPDSPFVVLFGYVESKIDVTELKNKMASEVGSHKLWGFSGFSGQMFFNMLASSAETDEGTDFSELLRDVEPRQNRNSSTTLTVLDSASNSLLRTNQQMLTPIS